MDEIAFDAAAIADAVAQRSVEQRWRPDQTAIVSAICAWQAARPDLRMAYADGRPDPIMASMISDASRDTGSSPDHVIRLFGAAHCLLCDVVPGFRPILASAWDRIAR